MLKITWGRTVLQLACCRVCQIFKEGGVILRSCEFGRKVSIEAFAHSEFIPFMIPGVPLDISLFSEATVIRLK